MDGIINFSEFFKDKKDLPKFDDTSDDFVEDEFIDDDNQEVANEEAATLIKEEIENIDQISMSDDISGETDEEVENTKDEFYKVYNDKAETFSCDIELEGANLKDTKVRLVLETENWNLVFNGNIDIHGKVTIPIKKLNLFEEGTTGKIKMEVVAEGTFFTPWEQDFKVKASKKVMVKFNENKNTIPTKPAVKVNFKK